jgi:hypothetical protein
MVLDRVKNFLHDDNSSQIPSKEPGEKEQASLSYEENKKAIKFKIENYKRYVDAAISGKQTSVEFNLRRDEELTKIEQIYYEMLEIGSALGHSEAIVHNAVMNICYDQGLDSDEIKEIEASLIIASEKRRRDVAKEATQRAIDSGQNVVRLPIKGKK